METKIASIADRDALRAWLKLNKMHFVFGRYTPDEVAYLARLAGFEALLVYDVISHFGDALAGTSIERRLRQQTSWFVAEVRGPYLDLTEQWQSLYWKLTEDRDFDD